MWPQRLPVMTSQGEELPQKKKRESKGDVQNTIKGNVRIIGVENNKGDTRKIKE
jgi:hypothetical protein